MNERAQLAERLLAWWDAGHSDLPWRGTRDPYAIWVSEIMLQQTQVTAVRPYYTRWMTRFPTVQALAAASVDEVLKLWEGLGYYSRARNLHAAAKTVVHEWHGRFPPTAADWMKLKGVGRYTAGAIASIAFDEPAPVVDGNVIRILSRLTDLPDDVTQTATKNGLWRLAAELVPVQRPGDYNQALMELGQQVCLPARPLCRLCPLAELCQARQRGTQWERPVRPPRPNTPHVDVVAAVIWHREEGGRFLIAQRPLGGLLGGLWEFPGGKLEAGETHPAALQREIAEELGMEIVVGDFLTEVKHAYTHFRITLHAFHARHIAGLPQNIGVAAHAWVTLPDLEQYPFAVTDQKIIAALKGCLAWG
jgi:A/G-specific adenine glycosylase